MSSETDPPTSIPQPAASPDLRGASATSRALSIDIPMSPPAAPAMARQTSLRSVITLADVPLPEVDVESDSSDLAMAVTHGLLPGPLAYKWYGYETCQGLYPDPVLVSKKQAGQWYQMKINLETILTCVYGQLIAQAQTHPLQLALHQLNGSLDVLIHDHFTSRPSWEYLWYCQHRIILGASPGTANYRRLKDIYYGPIDLQCRSCMRHPNSHTAGCCRMGAARPE